MILKGFQIIWGGTGLHPKRRCKQCVKNGYIFCYGEDVSNAMRKISLCMKEIKVIRKGIAPSYVVKEMRAIRKSQKFHPTL